jgi:hypothetical protein
LLVQACASTGSAVGVAVGEAVAVGSATEAVGDAGTMLPDARALGVPEPQPAEATIAPAARQTKERRNFTRDPLGTCCSPTHGRTTPHTIIAQPNAGRTGARTAACPP